MLCGVDSRTYLNVVTLPSPIQCHVGSQMCAQKLLLVATPGYDWNSVTMCFRPLESISSAQRAATLSRPGGLLLAKWVEEADCLHAGLTWGSTNHG